MLKQRLPFFLLALVASAFIYTNIMAAPPSLPQTPIDKLGPRLSELEKVHRSAGAAQARAFAQDKGIVMDRERVEAVLKFTAGRPVEEKRAESLGATISQRYRNLLLVKVPIARLNALSKNLPGLDRIRLPYRPYLTAVTSEGVEIMGGTDMHDLGSTGQGVRVAIIDAGFGNLAATQSAGDLPANVVTVDYTGTGIGGNKHGTAVAEVVHDMAPDAELYLLKVANDVHFGNAKDYCIANGIRVINASIVWFPAAGFYDGTGVICDIANDAFNNGILWVNSMGNYANLHYEATLTDTDNDRKHEFSGTDENLSFSANAGKQVQIILNWNDYIAPRSYTDYNLHVFNSSGAPVASSTDNQGFWVLPIEHLIFTAPATGTYTIELEKASSNELHLPFDIYVLTGSALEYKNKESSLAQPADASGVFSVGAVNLSDGLEGFSSQGPTNDLRTKPEVTATNRMTNSIYGTFAGTSASAPHVAGAAALALSQEPALTLGQLWDRLEAEVKDLGSAGTDNLYGAGRVSLDGDQDDLTHDDELAYNTDPLLVDTDGDGLGDGDEVNLYGSSPILYDSDGDYYSDGAEIAASSDPSNPGSTPSYQIGDIAPSASPDGVVDMADILRSMRIAMGMVPPTSLDLSRADIAPLGSVPDGVIDIADVLLMMQKAAGLKTF
jgi:subtilisin family serine protease